MAVKLRLARFGRLNHPTYRVCATEASFKRDGRVIETLGYYLPKAKRAEEQFKLDTDRIRYWLSVGAKPSETVASLIRRSGVEIPAWDHEDRKRKNPGKKSVAFRPPHRLGTGRLAKRKWRAKHAAKAGS